MFRFLNAREPMNSFTHFVGAVLSVAGTFLLVSGAVGDSQTSVRILLGALVFGLSLVALYSASALYHYVTCSDRAMLRLRKLDHAMIYVLIAGTYTPLFLGFSAGRGTLYTAVIWGVALVGIVVKLVWMDAPRWLSTLFYLAMGWAIILDWRMLLSIPVGCLWLIGGGGAAYTAGAVIYGVQRPNLSRGFGFHELFHVFVLLGSLLHFMAVYLYIV